MADDKCPGCGFTSCQGTSRDCRDKAAWQERQRELQRKGGGDKQNGHHKKRD